VKQRCVALRKRVRVLSVVETGEDTSLLFAGQIATHLTQLTAVVKQLEQLALNSPDAATQRELWRVRISQMNQEAKGPSPPCSALLFVRCALRAASFSSVVIFCFAASVQRSGFACACADALLGLRRSLDGFFEKRRTIEAEQSVRNRVRNAFHPLCSSALRVQ
jgi:hypothetical protein